FESGSLGGFHDAIPDGRVVMGEDEAHPPTVLERLEHLLDTLAESSEVVRPTVFLVASFNHFRATVARADVETEPRVPHRGEVQVRDVRSVRWVRKDVVDAFGLHVFAEIL